MACETQKEQKQKSAFSLCVQFNLICFIWLCNTLAGHELQIPKQNKKKWKEIQGKFKNEVEPKL